MADVEKLPEDLKDRVVTIGPEVRSEDIDTYRQLREIEDRSYKLRIVLNTWEGQQSEERKLRKQYANALKSALFIQGLLVNIAFFGIGFGLLSVEKWVAVTFIMAVFGETAAMVFIVVKYLFPDVSRAIHDLVERL